MSAFLFSEWLDKPVWMWIGFMAIVIGLLAFDLGVWHKDDKEMGISESLWLSAFYFLFPAPMVLPSGGPTKPAR